MEISSRFKPISDFGDPDDGYDGAIELKSSRIVTDEGLWAGISANGDAIRAGGSILGARGLWVMVKIIVMVGIIIVAGIFLLDIFETTKGIVNLKGSPTRRIMLGALLILLFCLSWFI